MDGLLASFVAGYTEQLVAKTKANHEDAEATEKNILDADLHGFSRMYDTDFCRPQAGILEGLLI
jgi:hypothetical protein